MIRPKIKGLKMTYVKDKEKKDNPIGKKGPGNLKGEFMGTQNQVR